MPVPRADPHEFLRNSLQFKNPGVTVPEHLRTRIVFAPFPEHAIQSETRVEKWNISGGETKNESSAPRRPDARRVRATSIHAGNWPHWRGPSRHRCFPGNRTARTWSATENVAWKAAVRGLGMSSPIVWGNRVFVTSQIGRGAVGPGPSDAGPGRRPCGGRRACPWRSAAAAAAGSVVPRHGVRSRRRAELWEYELQAEGPARGPRQAQSRVVESGHRRPNASMRGSATASSSRSTCPASRYGSGTSAPTTPVRNQLGTRQLAGHLNDSLFLICYHDPASYLLSLDAATGKTRWRDRARRGPPLYSTPLVVETGRPAEMIVNSSAGIAATTPPPASCCGTSRSRIGSPSRCPSSMTA